MLDSPALENPPCPQGNRARVVVSALLLTVLLAAVWVLYPTRPAFITHVGVIASAPGDETPLCLYFSYPRFRLARFSVVGVVLASGESLPAIGSTLWKPVTAASIRTVNCRFTPRTAGPGAIAAVRIKAGGAEATLPVGSIELLAYEPGTIEKRQATTIHEWISTLSTNEFRVHTSMPEGMAIQGFEPAIAGLTLQAEDNMPESSWYVNYGWLVTVAEQYWKAPTCIVYRPVLVTETEGVIRRSFGPSYEFGVAIPR